MQRIQSVPAALEASICGQSLLRRNSEATFAKNRNHHQLEASQPYQAGEQVQQKQRLTMLRLLFS
ncbi:hypothetical protein [Xanthomonas campestris]|uniref:hypothetical protein n=1 Tax=Xanthomonas campestris TaxID=339 RepID=UPI0023E98173|nr:hypothetical protein [Xanthomonas campestris]